MSGTGGSDRGSLVIVIALSLSQLNDFPVLDLSLPERERGRRMTVFHFFNCAILTFGPHAVYYSATPL